MGVYDRDYMDGLRVDGAIQAFWVSGALALAVAQAIAWAIRGAAPVASSFLIMDADAVFFQGEIWRVFSGAFFFDATTGKMFWTLAFILFLAPSVEDALGRVDFFAFYALAGASGCLAWGASVLWEPNLQQAAWRVQPCGTGAMAALAIAYLLRGPSRTVWIASVPIPAWSVVGLYFVGDLWFFAPRGSQALLLPTVIASGLFTMICWQWDIRATRALAWLHRRKPREARVEATGEPAFRPGRSMTAVQGEPLPALSNDDDWESQVDAVLAKITESGAQSLSDDDRRLLEEASRRYQRRRAKPRD